MGTKAVLVQRTKPVNATPWKVWQLAASPLAMSAVPGWFAFAVPAEVPAADRLCCLITTGPLPLGCIVLDVQQEEPGQTITWQARHPSPVGSSTLTLSVLPRRTGCALRVTMRGAADRIGWANETQSARRQVVALSRGLRAIAEDRAAWPQSTMPEGMRARCARLVPLTKPASTSAGVMISAPAAAVWEAVRAGMTTPYTSPAKIFSGRVPGTPAGEPGEMTYGVWRWPDDRFRASLAVVREVSGGQKLVLQDFYRPYEETAYLVSAADGGTRLDLQHRWSTAGNRSRRRDPATTAGQLQELADHYKAAIEAAAGSQTAQ